MQQSTLPNAANASHEYLAFQLGREEYGIDIQKAQEIHGYEAVPRIANAPDFIKGVVNLRGTIVTIVDMRIRLNLGTSTYDQFTAIVILNVNNGIVGIVVDSVSDVITLTAEQIQAAPEIGMAMNSDHLIGLGTHNGQMLILVDIDRLISFAELGFATSLAA
ncbi:chemotaxis protein CheW [Noviherbaspirillum pedocola]|uniref:Chemotaxis protein CheW n=1 Tax=Noviherbaspirillum pedocola TaxID=2801341 RepID=A0A934T2M3_9BURK|nr:chemotaxis protein CheW [Noviherbaspirillum pedocola]MBK4738422.1 chemotaxis protein CheW [Noviherbaspirillum pedocola]